MSESFDDLARTLARPMPRRRALRLVGGLLVAAAMPGALRTSAALGGPKSSHRMSTCSPTCSNSAAIPMACPVAPAKDICFITCAEPGSKKCCLFEAGKPSGIVACPDGYDCPKGGRGSCVCLKNCGGNCCKTTEYCANFQQRLCCERGWRGCALECCKPNEECRKIRVGTGSQDICTKRCPPNQAWCGKDHCCPPKWKCVNESTGRCKRCWPDEEECEKKCCNRKTSRCCGKAGCCPKDRSCCVTGKTQRCCPAGQKCAIPILADNIGIKAGTSSICCPSARYNKSPELCCPPGQVALNTPGFRTPPPGISPYCCPPGQVCGAGAGKACVDLQSDSMNCGRCGNVCESGICSRGVCALP